MKPGNKFEENYGPWCRKARKTAEKVIGKFVFWKGYDEKATVYSCWIWPRRTHMKYSFA
jgi:hypothetical protein